MDPTPRHQLSELHRRDLLREAEEDREAARLYSRRSLAEPIGELMQLLVSSVGRGKASRSWAHAHPFQAEPACLRAGIPFQPLPATCRHALSIASPSHCPHRP